jgi:hypothetical protein
VFFKAVALVLFLRVNCPLAVILTPKKEILSDFYLEKKNLFGEVIDLGPLAFKVEAA